MGSKKTASTRNVCHIPYMRRTVVAMQEVAFHLPKGHLLHAKRPCFAMRKTAYRQAADSQRLTEAAQTVMKERSRRQVRTAETKRKGRANDVSARLLRRRKWSHRESNSDLIFRRDLFYPLNYETHSACKGNLFKA